MTDREPITFLTQTKYHYDDDTESLPSDLQCLTFHLAASVDLALRNKGYETMPHLGAAQLMYELNAAGYPVILSDIYNGLPNNPVVCISAMDINIDEVMSKVEGNPRKKFIIGGIGITPYLEKALSGNTNMVIVEGSGTGIIREAIDSECGTIYQADRKQIPVPLEHRIKVHQSPFLAKPIFQVTQISEGCNQKCSFCRHGEVYVTPIEEVKAELEAMNLPDSKRPFPVCPHILFFLDLNLAVCPDDYLEELFDYTNSRGIRWIGEMTIMEKLNNERLLGKMAKGCLGCLIGVEDFFNPIPGSPEKNQLQKDFSEVSQYLKTLSFPAIYSIIFGTDNQDPSIFPRTAELISRLGICAYPHILAPRAGTPDFERIIKEGRLVDIKSSHRDMSRHLPHQPKHMTREQCLGGYIRFKETVYSPQEITNRYWRNSKHGIKYATALAAVEITQAANGLVLKTKYPELSG